MDATTHLDGGAVDDGMTPTDIDPDKVYGFRANILSGAELKSVKLELRGPGADDMVNRTENYQPYSLHGDSNGEDMAYTDADVESGVEYRYRVAAVNSAHAGIDRTPHGPAASPAGFPRTSGR